MAGKKRGPQKVKTAVHEQQHYTLLVLVTERILQVEKFKSTNPLNAQHIHFSLFSSPTIPLSRAQVTPTVQPQSLKKYPIPTKQPQMSTNREAERFAHRFATEHAGSIKIPVSSCFLGAPKTINHPV